MGSLFYSQLRDFRVNAKLIFNLLDWSACVQWVSFTISLSLLVVAADWYRSFLCFVPAERKKGSSLMILRTVAVNQTCVCDFINLVPPLSPRSARIWEFQHRVSCSQMKWSINWVVSAVLALGAFTAVEIVIVRCSLLLLVSWLVTRLLTWDLMTCVLKWYKISLNMGFVHAIDVTLKSKN